MMGSAGITNEYGITNMYMNGDIHRTVSSGSAELNKGAFRTNEMGRWHEAHGVNLNLLVYSIFING